ncbi:MAG: GNAT family N-acetyltransferase [Chloroflexota bacterium]
MPGLLAAEIQNEFAGYIRLQIAQNTGLVYVNDLAVQRKHRHHGVGTALLLGAQTWAANHGADRIVLEMQSKNFPAISLVNKLGFEFCGYNDRYYDSLEIALFFAKRV